MNAPARARLSVMVYPHHQPSGPYIPAGYAMPYLPGGCPEDMTDWPATDGLYPGPHQLTVCPACLADTRLGARVSAPHPTRPTTPMITALAPIPFPPTTHPSTTLLLRLLRPAGFTCIARLPLSGFPDETVLVADDTTRDARILLHSLGLEYHLRHPDTGEALRGCLEPPVDLPALTTVLRTAGHTTPTPAIPPLPPGAHLLTPDDAAHLIAIGDHPAGQRSDLAHNLALIDAVRAGLIYVARLADGTLAFTPHPTHG